MENIAVRQVNWMRDMSFPNEERDELTASGKFSNFLNPAFRAAIY
jgi:hypothetical protein